MDDLEFDRALVGAGFALIAESGWRGLTVTAAARRAALPLDRARGRFSGRAAILCRFGRLADQAALADAPAEGTVRDRLFDMIMRRIDVLQAHRAGVLALFRDLRFDPCTSLALGAASLASMHWLLEAAGAGARGPRGALRAKGLLAVWLWTVRAWRTDESVDLAATMAALDRALARAAQAEGWVGGGRRASPAPSLPGDPTDGADEPPGESADPFPA